MDFPEVPHHGIIVRPEEIVWRRHLQSGDAKISNQLASCRDLSR
jgi:hypothetical protein